MTSFWSCFRTNRERRSAEHPSRIVVRVGSHSASGSGLLTGSVIMTDKLATTGERPIRGKGFIRCDRGRPTARFQVRELPPRCGTKSATRERSSGCTVAGSGLRHPGLPVPAFRHDAAWACAPYPGGAGGSGSPAIAEASAAMLPCQHEFFRRANRGFAPARQNT